MKSRILSSGLLLLLPLLASCGGDSTSAPVPTSIVVTPGSATIDALGLTEQFSAQVLDNMGNIMTGSTITWASTNPSVASIGPSGLAVAVRRGTATIQASAEGLTGGASLNVNPLPAEVLKNAGDGQTGALSQPLAEALEVEILDSQGNPVEDATVTFSVLAGDGTVTPSLSTTNALGQVSAVWTLGCSNDNPQRVVASSGGLSVEFTATADLDLPAICQEEVPDGRVTFPYAVQIEVVGGDQGTIGWSLESGTLPGGVSFSTDGLLSGTPTDPGSFTFRALAQDGMGNSAARDFGIRICEAPLTLATGESAFLEPSGPDGCGFFLPSGGTGDRYRFGVLWATSRPADTLNSPLVTVSITKELALGASADPVPIQRYAPAPDGLDWLEGLPEHLRRALEVDAATEAFHHRLREKEWHMIRGMGAGVRTLPDVAPLHRAAGLQSSAPDKINLFANPESECAATAQVTALKVSESENMVFYQDSAQAQIDTLRVTEALADMMLDYYEDYGKQVIDEYFGGVTDINDDGRIVVFASPVVSEGVAAYVWSGDFFPTGSCNASNEMELIRFSASVIREMLNGSYQALATLVHEAKHVSSLYKSIARYDMDPVDYYQPNWVEEGTAEIAGEISSRVAWAATGGPPVNALVDTDARRLAYDQGTGAPLKESYGALLRWARTIFYLGSQPNGVVGTPVGAPAGHSVYGSGWHFHRWLGDAHGNAASSPMGDAPLFTYLNDSLTAVGAEGIKNVTGLLWEDLLDQYASAIMLSGIGVPQPDWAFSSYDFPAVTTDLLQSQRSGFYPWPVNVSGDNTTQTFASLVNSGYVGPSGIRIYDLSSDGSGLGVSVQVETTRSPVRIVVVRIQ